MPVMMTNQHTNSGFTLIEVLVALLIVAIGLLSVAALQLQGLKYSHEAYLRSQINILAYDIAERMRLNRSNAASYVGNYTIPASAPAGCTTSTAGNAANDLACWRQQVFNALPPGGSANITANGDLYTITLSWLEKEDGTPREITYTFQP